MHAFARIAGPIVLLTACSGPAPSAVQTAPETAQTGRPAPPPPKVAPKPSPTPACTQSWVAREGAIERRCAPENAVPIDLGDGWAPGVLAPTADDAGPEYRAAYLAEARQADPQVAFGVFPTLSVIRDRLADSARHACHDKVDAAVLDQRDQVIRGWQRMREQQATAERQLGILRAQQAEGKPLNAWEQNRLAEVEVSVAEIRAVKGHLRCEGAKLDDDAVLDYATMSALEAFQVRNMLLPTRNVNRSTRRLLSLDSRLVDYRAALRVLRERVAQAGGLLADGSAANAWQPVMGQHLEDEEMRHALRPSPMPDALPDHVAQATEAAAKALGWTSPEATLAALREPPEGPVWVELPFAWDRHAKLAVRAEIDRGDVWYDDPYSPSGKPRHQPVDNLPMLTVFIKHEDRWRPAVRWPVTIGGWKKEQKDGHVALSYENSPVGPVVWRDVIAAPVWLPPKGIPDETLMTRREGEWVVDRDTVGPGPTSAFGLAMVVHHRVDGDAPPQYMDRGIRVHGTGSLASVVDGDRDSHGCHRGFPHLVLRLTNFLLHHREHVRHGSVETSYRRALRDGAKQAQLRIDSRGYRYELTPPIDVEVLEGRVMGRQKEPIRRRLALRERR